MKLSKRGEYGMMALCHLAERYGGGLSHIRSIAAEQKIPPKFLESILLQLKRSGFVTSRRGNDGGYALAAPPEKIVLGHVIRALDGPLSPIASGAELRRVMQRHSNQPGLYAVLMDVREAVAGILDRTSLADVLRRNDDARRRTPSSAGRRDEAET